MLLTAYNQDVQAYLAPPNKTNKTTIITEIKESALANGINFNRLFPNRTKRYDVLDEIVYLLSNGGICTIESTTLAKRVGSSTRTVYDAVNRLKELDLFIVAGLADGKNKYVFVYKNHTNFQAILNDVFYVDEIEIAEQVAEQVAEQENSESIDTPSVDEDKTEPISTISLISKDLELKQESNNYTHAREAFENEAVKDVDKHLNPSQLKLYDYIKESRIDQRLISNADRIALRAGSNLTHDYISYAIRAVYKIDQSLFNNDETTIDSIPAYFDRVYKDLIRWGNSASMPEKTVERDTSFYYDWLNE